MAYKLYTDKAETFECAVQIKNASLKDAFARIIVEAQDGLNLMFRGELKNGKCIVPIKRLRGLLEESVTGKIHLEVVVEDTYFRPWQDDFIVEEHTQLKVQVKEQTTPTKPTLSISPPKVSVPVSSKPRPNDSLLFEITTVLNKFGINRSNLATSKRNNFKQVIKEYFRINKISDPKRQNQLIKEVASLIT